MSFVRGLAAWNSPCWRVVDPCCPVVGCAQCSRWMLVKGPHEKWGGGLAHHCFVTMKGLWGTPAPEGWHPKVVPLVEFAFVSLPRISHMTALVSCYGDAELPLPRPSVFCLSSSPYSCSPSTCPAGWRPISSRVRLILIVSSPCTGKLSNTISHSFPLSGMTCPMLSRAWQHPYNNDHHTRVNIVTP
jgi:hypothetical protein